MYPTVFTIYIHKLQAGLHSIRGFSPESLALAKMQKNWRHKHKGIRTKKEKESIHYVCQNRNPPFSPLPKLIVLPKSADIANAKSSHYHDGKVPDYLHSDISDIYFSSCHPHDQWSWSHYVKKSNFNNIKLSFFASNMKWSYPSCTVIRYSDMLAGGRDSDGNCIWLSVW